MALIVINGPEGPQERKLFRSNTFGRHPENTHQILDRIVSKQHCRIEIIGHDHSIEDLGSMNGTLVNGVRIARRQKLRHGDVIRIGDTSMRFTADDEWAHDLSGMMALPLVASDDGESLVQSRGSALQPEPFRPASEVADANALRQDYERLRAAYELTQAIGAEPKLSRVIEIILDVAFRLVPADRAAIFLYDQKGVLRPRALRTNDELDPGESVKVSNTVIEEALRTRSAILSHDAMRDVRFQSAHSVIMEGIRSTLAIPIIYINETFGVIVIDSKVSTHAFTRSDLQLFETLGSQAAVAVQNAMYSRRLEQEAITRERFQRLLSPAIAAQVLAGGVEIQRGGELRQTTVMFADIRGFTAMSENSNPEHVVAMLNEHFEVMVDIVFRHEGTLDKFIGDELMALFGAPVAHDDDPDRAVRSALSIQAALKTMNAQRRENDQAPVSVGIGINTGEVVAGYIGSSRAMEYTVVGDPVNIAARLCSLAEPGQILITEATSKLLRGGYELRLHSGSAELKGRTERVALYEVLARTD